MDSLIIEGLINKDNKAIHSFLDGYAGFIYSVIYNVLKSKQDSEEATQDVVMKIIQKADTFDFSSSLKTWIFIIAKRTAIDYKRRVKYTDDIESNYDLAAMDDASDLLKISEEQKMVNELLDTLNESDRMLIELFYLKEMSIKEIEEITKLSASNIKVKLYRLRQLLAEKAPKITGYEL